MELEVRVWFYLEKKDSTAEIKVWKPQIKSQFLKYEPTNQRKGLSQGHMTINGIARSMWQSPQYSTSTSSECLAVWYWPAPIMNVNQFIISILGVKIKPYFCLDMNFLICMPIKKILVPKNLAINMKQLKIVYFGTSQHICNLPTSRKSYMEC